jgi:tetratricopeptide (TPR) repeat protein
MAATAAALSNQNPYPGPRPFCRDERSVFCGRNYEARELFSLVVAHKIVLLYSQSGAGKSSLLSAGLAPLLQEEGFIVFPIARVAGRVPQSVSLETVPNPYALNVLLSWSHQEDTLDPNQLATVTLSQFLKRNPGWSNTKERGTVRVLFFDQFEELFTYYPERWKERAEFIDQVAAALNADDYLRVVIGMREEYLGPLYVHAHTLPESLDTRFRLERLGPEEALEAITEPLKPTPRHFAPGVAESLVEELLKVKVAVDHKNTVEVTGEYVEPVQLQVVCSGLWEKLPPTTQEITFEYLEDFGDVTDALSAFYEESLKEAAQRARVTEGTLRKWFERTLITPAGTRGTVFRGASETGGLPNAAVDALEAKHIIRCDSRSGSAWYELTHDRFIDPVLKSNARWRQSHGDVELLRRELEEKAKKWDQGGRLPAELLSGQKLTEAQSWLSDPKAAELGWSDNVVAFISASATEAERRRERQRQMEEQARSATRLRVLAGVLSGVCVLCCLLSVFLWKQVKRARRATENAIKANTEKEHAQKTATKMGAEAHSAEQALRNQAFEALRVRQQTLIEGESEIALLDALIKKSTPSEAADWHLQKSELLLQQERFAEAAAETNAVLDVAPDYAVARTSRGYALMLQNHPNEALVDFVYIRDKINAKDTLNYLNLSIVFAQLGRKSDAQQALDQAIFYSQHGQNSGGAEEVVPPEITQATLRRSLVANGEIFRQALYFMKAVLDAWSGGDSFLTDLQAAQEQARGIREDEKQEASLIALTWAWFVERGNKPEYGLEAGKGMLWEEAGNSAFAARHFEAFKKAYAERKEARYHQLAGWVQEQKTEPSQVEFSFAKDDPVFLEAQSELLGAQGKYSEAEQVLNQAIDREPVNARLYFDRMTVYYKEGLYNKVLADCEHVLKLPGVAPDAYYERAMAKYYLGASKEDVIRDLQKAVELQPDHRFAIEDLGYVVDEAYPDQPERAAKWYNLYDRLFPITRPDILARRAKVQNKMNQFADAYDTIQKTIALDPANREYYEIREEAEKGLGFTEVQIKRDRVEGARAATDFLRRRAHPEDQRQLGTWESERWKILSQFGDQFSNEQTRCNEEVSTCVTFKVTHEQGEWAYLKIISVEPSHGDKRIVKIDRGFDDGVVLGSIGNVYSPPSVENGHERKVSQIGTAEILSIEPRSSLLMVKMSNPSGDGMVRTGDAVGMSIRTPDLPDRSQLWHVLNASITLSDLDGQKIADFRTLYKDESPEVDQRIYQKLLDDIHETGLLYGDQLDQGKPISAVKLAENPRRLREILVETTRKDLDCFLEYVVKFKAGYFGQDWKIGLAYADWVKSGMPDK